MNAAQRRFINDRIETLDDEIDALKDKIDELDREREDCQNELDQDEMVQLNRQYERSV